MPEVEFFATPGYGETMLKNRNYSQAVKIGDRVEISGQGGWDDELNFPESLEDEIVRAFDNVERTLRPRVPDGPTWLPCTRITFRTRWTPSANRTIGS